MRLVCTSCYSYPWRLSKLLSYLMIKKKTGEIKKAEQSIVLSRGNGLADFGSAWSKLTPMKLKSYISCEELVIEKKTRVYCKRGRDFYERIRKGK